MRRPWAGRERHEVSSKGLFALDPTAERRFRLSQLAERLGDREEARRQLEEAVAAEPANMEYKAALGYALRKSGDLAGAAQLLSGVLAARPSRYALHEDLGYTYLGLGENDKAIDQFKWVIDNQQLYPNETQEEARDHRAHDRGAAPDINAVEPHWTAYGYTNLCLTGHYCERRTRNLESLISTNQGGLELDYQPPNMAMSMVEYSRASRVLSSVTPPARSVRRATAFKVASGSTISLCAIIIWCCPVSD